MKYIWTGIILLIATQAFAQNIPQKGNLGVKLAQAPENEHGAIYAIAEVTPNSTAEGLALLPGDILIEINDEVFDSPSKISEVIGKFKAGEIATSKVLRKGKLVKSRGKIKAPPPFKNENHQLEHLEVPFKDGYVRAYLTTPQGEGPFPTIYYIQGYPCQSINNHPLSPVLQLTSHLVDLGYAVFRIEKPGVGEFVNLSPCSEYSFDDEVENFSNGLSFLRKLSKVDDNKIYLFGHSLGGNVAPIIAENDELSGIMVYGTLIKPWQDYLVDMAYYSQTHAQDAIAVHSAISTLKSALDKLYVKVQTVETLNAEEKALLENWHDFDGSSNFFNRKLEFWQSFNSHNYFDAWSKVKVPVLAMYGESDAHAIGPLDAELIATLVNKNYDGNGTYQMIENTNHLFASVDSKAKELEYINNGLSTQIAFTQFNKELPIYIDQWIKSEKNKQSQQSYAIASTLFPKSETNMSSMDISVADFNGDQQNDIVLATEFGPNKLFVFENGEWISSHLPQLKEYDAPYLGEDSEDIAVFDIDNDGDLDLFFVSEDTPNHELLTNDGNGNFTFLEFQIEKNGHANAVLTYDFNQDGWEDILIGVRGQNELWINALGKTFVNKTSDFWPFNEDHTQDLVLVDIDNDEDLDIVEGIEQGGNNLYINVDGRFVEQSYRLRLPEDIETRKVVVDDFDGDGDQDLFYCNVGWNPQKNPQNQLLINDGKGNFENQTKRLPKDWSTTLDATFIDINGDDVLDIITTNFVNDLKVKIFLGARENETINYAESEKLLPFLSFYGGTSVLAFSQGGQDYLYFANFKSEDILLKKK